jgi:nitroimidazol reductase NimA-like FMN-containing flavoprotein (pyridoxamine 5'-phosphate oxidase superfamily)
MNSMRRSDRQMSDIETQILLKAGEYGILAAVNSVGQPSGIPLSYIYLNDSIYFHCAMEGTMLQNLADNPQVCFTVVGKTKVISDKFTTNYESVMAFGTVSMVEGPEKKAALGGFIYKYSPCCLESGKAYIEKAQAKTIVVKITIKHLTGKHRVG